jgi:hypothetical protein
MSFLSAEIEERFLASLGMTGLLHDDAQTWQRSTDSGIKPPLHKTNQAFRPWHFLYFFPEPHGHGSLRPTFAPARTGFGASACAAPD